MPVVIPNVVNHSEFYYTEKITADPPSKLEIVLAGIYDSRKGADYILTVLPLFLNEYPDTILHLVGEANAERMAELRSIILIKGIEKSVEFHGKLSPAALCNLYHHCDFYVCSSVWESFGLSVLEALFCGLPVLATNCGGVTEFMNNQNGLLIENDRCDETLLNGLLEITDKLKKYNRQSSSLEAVKQFSPQLIREKYYNIYQQVLTGR